MTNRVRTALSRPRPGSSFRSRALLLVVALLAIGAVACKPGASGINPAVDATITSPGPLTSISISSDLNCAVNHVGDTFGEFYGDTACGTFIAVGGTLYGPAVVPAGDGPGGAFPRTTYTAVSQVGPIGTGTAGDPFKIVTVVALGTTGITLTETDSYVVGRESYTTDVQLSNTTASAVPVRVYRAGDCFLQNSDFGYGSVGPAGAVACRTSLDPTSRIEQWNPITAGSHYVEDLYRTVWADIGSQNAFPDTCTCATLLDNGAGLSWDVTVPALGQTTVSSLITFSPLGRVPLITTKTADNATVAPGGTDGYTISISNPNSTGDATLNSITDTLPAGFTYVTGSTTGATTADPTVSGQSLTWNGPITVPAGNGSVSLHFNVHASTVPGDYMDNAGGDAGTDSVTATGPTAKVTVVSGSGPQVSIGDVSVFEGTKTSLAEFSLTLSEPSSSPVTVSYATANDTATAPGDYFPLSGTLTFAPGTTTQKVDVPVIGDTDSEGSEAFKVNLSSPVNATIAHGTGTGTILDGPNGPGHLAVGSVNAYEGTKGTAAHFTVTLSAPSTSPVTVNYAFANGTATLPGDYFAGGGSLTFAPGETAKTIFAWMNGDTDSEGSEAFTVTLSGASGADIINATGTGTVLDGI